MSIFGPGPREKAGGKGEEAVATLLLLQSGVSKMTQPHPLGPAEIRRGRVVSGAAPGNCGGGIGEV